LIAAGVVLLALCVFGVVKLIQSNANREGESPGTGAQTPAPPPPPAPERAVPAPPPTLTAALEVVTRPEGAAVWVDGAQRSERSNARLSDLRPGPRSIEVRKEGFRPESRNVTLQPGANPSLVIELTALGGTSPTSKPGGAAADTAAGILRVTAKPYADYFVDEEKRGGNLPTFQMRIAPGKHRVRAVHPQLGTKEWKDVVVASGKTTHLVFDFTVGDMGALRVAVKDGWGYVLIDGRDQLDASGKPFQAPGVITKIPKGLHSIELKCQGCGGVEGSPAKVKIEPGDTALVKFRVLAK
jgi:hypothetical protein